MTFFGALLLAAAAILLPETSDLVPEDHVHDWVEVEGEKDFTLIDENWTSTVEIDGKNYPTILMRGIGEAGSDREMHADFIVAVDCERRLSAPVEGTAIVSATKETMHKRIPDPIFTSDEESDAVAEKMYSQVCTSEVSK